MGYIIGDHTNEGQDAFITNSVARTSGGLDILDMDSLEKEN
jgi:hypothetical protein